LDSEGSTVRFARERAESERFARALEPSPTPRNGEFADELAIVGALRALGEAGSPDPATRQRIRAEIAGRLETAAVTHRRRWRPRTADLVAAALFGFLVLAGLTLVLSRNALPGDPLYAVKRAGENTALGLTFGDQARAAKHLEFATNRVTELGKLADHGASASAYRTALDDFSSDVREGVSQLTALATGDGGAQELSDLRLWARDQSERLAAHQGALPAAASGAFGEARGLLDRVEVRTTELVSRLNCYQITSGQTDELGAVPAKGECTQKPLGQQQNPLPAPPGPPSTTEPGAPPAASTELPATGATPTPGTPPPTGGTAPPVIPAPIPSPTLPRLPTPTSTPPPLISIPPLLPGLPPIVIG
jgi:hypothetical protein